VEREREFILWTMSHDPNVFEQIHRIMVARYFIAKGKGNGKGEAPPAQPSESTGSNNSSSTFSQPEAPGISVLEEVD